MNLWSKSHQNHSLRVIHFNKSHSIERPQMILWCRIRVNIVFDLISNYIFNQHIFWTNLLKLHTSCQGSGIKAVDSVTTASWHDWTQIGENGERKCWGQGGPEEESRGFNLWFLMGVRNSLRSISGRHVESVCTGLCRHSIVDGKKEKSSRSR
jgi:hypothetical protein